MSIDNLRRITEEERKSRKPFDRNYSEKREKRKFVEMILDLRKWFKDIQPISYIPELPAEKNWREYIKKKELKDNLNQFDVNFLKEYK